MKLLSYLLVFLLLTIEVFANSYPSQNVIDRQLFELEREHPDVARVIKLGNSTEGRPVYGLKLGRDTVDARPEISLMGGMHGDEIVGREILLYFAQDLLDSKTTEEISDLLNQMIIYIIPCVNPDGCEYNLRTNVNGVDLNREFPDFTTTDNINDPSGRAIEIQNLMNFEKNHDINMSLVFHGGEIPTVNYPWDTTGDTFPLENFAREIALVYASHNPSMSSNTRFPGGVANGHDWYTIDGGMQDWAYFYHDNLQLTIETTLLERPPYETIYGHYMDNRQSIFNYLKQSNSGAGIKNMPLNIEGTITVFSLENKKMISQTAYTGRGKYFKLLPKGHYEFVASLKGHEPKSFKLKVKDDDRPGVMNFISW